VIPEIDIWRAAQLMQRYGDKALDKSSDRTGALPTSVLLPMIAAPSVFA
jgi:hypothetical protein